MSGAASLAAARRRRAGGSTQNIVQPSPTNTQKQSAPSNKNPLTVIMEHDKQIGLLTKEMELIKENQPKETSVKDLDFYKDKYETLLSQMTELKTTLVKLQSYSMQHTTDIQSLKDQRSNIVIKEELEEND